MSDWLDFDRRHLWHPYTSMTDPLPVYPVVSASGVRLRLDDGRELIDGMSSWWAAIHGYNHPALNAAMKDQLGAMAHVMFGGITHPAAVGLCERLLKIAPSGLDCVFLCDSGSVAVEVAMKMAIQYWGGAGQPERKRFLTVRGGYHGDTFHAMSVSDPETGMHGLFRGALPAQLFADLPPAGFDAALDEARVQSFRELLELHKSEIAAVILEPIVQGAGGMRFHSPEYLRRIHDLTREAGILLILDEIATGFGRTGRMFACEHAGIVPDIMCVGKALTGGYMTLGATLATRAVAAKVSAGGQVFMHGPTFMGNPLACSVASASIDLLTASPWPEQVRRIEGELELGLSVCRDLPQVAEVRVLGAIGVVEMREPVPVAAFQREFVKRGVWVRPFGRLVYVMPPYVMDSADLATLTRAMSEVVRLNPGEASPQTLLPSSCGHRAGGAALLRKKISRSPDVGAQPRLRDSFIHKHSNAELDSSSTDLAGQEIQRMTKRKAEMDQPRNDWREQIREWEAKGRRRSLRTMEPMPGHRVTADGRSLLNLASNDYLSFGCDEELHRSFVGGMKDEFVPGRHGFAASASRLLSGGHPAYAAMEASLEAAYGPDRRALVLNSGYHANIGILPALAGRGDLILSDRLNHASLVDGIRLSRAEWVRYRHGDSEHLREVLQSRRKEFRRAFLVTESIFSMDGDVADLKAMRDLKREFDAILYVDEAHAVGVRGQSGLGLSEEAGVLGDVDILVGTFGKALASTGAYVISDEVIHEMLVNAMRSLIFTTALPPVVLGWSRHVFERVLKADDRRARLRETTVRFRQELEARGVPTAGETHIVPVMAGADAVAVALSEGLRDAGFLVPPIRPPTVPEGTARLRCSLGAEMNPDDLGLLAKEIARFREQNRGAAR